jgi:hypothetical protein
MEWSGRAPAPKAIEAGRGRSHCRHGGQLADHCCGLIAGYDRDHHHTASGRVRTRAFNCAARRRRITGPIGSNDQPAGRLCAAEKWRRQMAVMGRVSRVPPVQTAMRNCTRDEGGPFDFGNQVLISSHRKLLWSKAVVVSVAETSGR